MRRKMRIIVNVCLLAPACLLIVAILLAAAILLSGRAASANGGEPTEPRDESWSQPEKSREGRSLPEKSLPETRFRPETPQSRPQMLQQLQPQPKQDSRELQLQDMLMVLLLPHMEHKLAEAYADVLKEPPMLYPYFVDVVSTERLNGFRGFSLRIVLDAVPTVGPHIAVGEDKFTFDISPIVDVKLVRYEHVKGPDPNSFPPNYKDLLK